MNLRTPLALFLLHAALAAADPDPLFRIREGRKVGYINRTGQVVIPPKFETAEDFHEGLARVYVGAEAGFIDRAGKFVIKPIYTTATDRSLAPRPAG